VNGSDREPDLRYRIRRTARLVGGQHERLAPIFAELESAVASGGTREAETAAFRLEGAMRAHFLLEEQIFFPALQSLYPDREPELRVLVKDHERLRAQLRTLIDRILAAELQLAAKSIADCSAALLEHEAREEVFVKALAEDKPE
jgi:hypothetical protein